MLDNSYGARVHVLKSVDLSHLLKLFFFLSANSGAAAVRAQRFRFLIVRLGSSLSLLYDKRSMHPQCCVKPLHKDPLRSFVKSTTDDHSRSLYVLGCSPINAVTFSNMNATWLGQIVYYLNTLLGSPEHLQRLLIRCLTGLPGFNCTSPWRNSKRRYLLVSIHKANDLLSCEHALGLSLVHVCPLFSYRCRLDRLCDPPLVQSTASLRYLDRWARSDCLVDARRAVQL